MYDFDIIFDHLGFIFDTLDIFFCFLEALEVPKTPSGHLGAPWGVPEEPKDLQGSIFIEFGINFGSHLGPILGVFSI